jgi:predicted nucleotidyltransferase component of viral defense system
VLLRPSSAIEAFHLGFLEVLRKRLDPQRYVLKGGANLRYFFGSVRYSEDIDFDVLGVPVTTLEGNVDAVLASSALAVTLRSAGLEVVADDVSKPKQTATTRRWKVPIALAGQRAPIIRTKIEFSSRDSDDRRAVEAVPERVVRPYGLRPPTVQHYLAEPATEQKIRALAGRSQTQARDVFDLDLLLRAPSSTIGAVDAEPRRTAADRGIELPYEAFADQVLPFLDPGVAELYDEVSWDRMRLSVADRLLEGEG